MKNEKPQSEWTGWDYLNQPWPLNCQQCGVKWGEVPLIQKALGNTPAYCPECMLKFMKMVNDPPKNTGMTITFNGWKKP